MSKPTHQIVNGVRIPLTPAEIAEIQAEWDRTDIIIEAEKIEQAKKQAAFNLLKSRLGLTDEELEMLRKGV